MIFLQVILAIFANRQNIIPELMKVLSDQKIVDSWKKNGSPWIEAIRKGEIESRVKTTNQAIVDAVIKQSPKVVLDIGCGEGWLVRELTKTGIDALGVDVVPELINYAIDQGDGRYKILSYEDISYDILKEKYDVIAANFSLLGNESVTEIFKKVSPMLEDRGYFIVQTIHPITSVCNQDYKDGWRNGNWDGFNELFTDPAPWYFRTIETWRSLFLTNGFILDQTLEPLNIETETTLSIIFVGRQG